MDYSLYDLVIAGFCVFRSSRLDKEDVAGVRKSGLEWKDTVPIYEYRAAKPDKGCVQCRVSFEILQKLEEEPLQRCPGCGTHVKKLISRCRGVVVEPSGEAARTVKQIQEYERSGMWSHAAEMADIYSEKTKDKNLRARAMEDYRKAGHDVDGLLRD